MACDIVLIEAVSDHLCNGSLKNTRRGGWPPRGGRRRDAPRHRGTGAQKIGEGAGCLFVKGMVHEVYIEEIGRRLLHKLPGWRATEMEAPCRTDRPQRLPCLNEAPTGGKKAQRRLVDNEQAVHDGR